MNSIVTSISRQSH